MLGTEKGSEVLPPILKRLLIIPMEVREGWGRYHSRQSGDENLRSTPCVLLKELTNFFICLGDKFVLLPSLACHFLFPPGLCNGFGKAHKLGSVPKTFPKPFALGKHIRKCVICCLLPKIIKHF